MLSLPVHTVITEVHGVVLQTVHTVPPGANNRLTPTHVALEPESMSIMHHRIEAMKQKKIFYTATIATYVTI